MIRSVLTNETKPVTSRLLLAGSLAFVNLNMSRLPKVGCNNVNGHPCSRCSAVEAWRIEVPWCPGVMEAHAASGAPSLCASTATPARAAAATTTKIISEEEKEDC